MQHIAAVGLVLHCLPMSHKKTLGLNGLKYHTFTDNELNIKTNMNTCTMLFTHYLIIYLYIIKFPRHVHDMQINSLVYNKM